MSGGRATVKKGAVRQAGDITAVAPEGHVLTDYYYIECKHLKNISLDSLIKGKGALINIWVETVKQAVKYDRAPVLIFRQNHWPTVFCTSDYGADGFSIIRDELIYIRAICHTKGKVVTLNLLRFDELLKSPFPLK